MPPVKIMREARRAMVRMWGRRERGIRAIVGSLYVGGMAVVVWLSLWWNDLGSRAKSRGEGNGGAVVDVEYAMKRKEMELLHGLEKEYMNIEICSYLVQTDAVIRILISATNPADLLNRSAPRRTVGCRLENPKSGQHFIHLPLGSRVVMEEESSQLKRIALL